MAYQVLARKWRPKTFSDLVGQEHVVKALRNALEKGRLHHAYLLTGTRGVGKTTIARILAVVDRYVRSYAFRSFDPFSDVTRRVRERGCRQSSGRRRS